MLPSSSLSFSSPVFQMSSEVSKRENFIQQLQDWVTKAPPKEKKGRIQFAEHLEAAFDTEINCFPCDYSADLWDFQHTVTSLPSCIGSLHALKKLDLNSCQKLQSLPPEIGNLHALETLSLHGCESLTSLPPEIGNLSSLTTLNLTGCSNLESVPVEIGNIPNLKYFMAVYCKKLIAKKPETFSIEDLSFFELSEFFKPLERFNKYIQQFYSFHSIHHPSITPLKDIKKSKQITDLFLGSFKDRIIEKRLQKMETEHLQSHDAIKFLCEDPQTADTLKFDEHGLALPLRVLEQFIAEDARVHCLRIIQEREDGLTPKVV